MFANLKGTPMEYSVSDKLREIDVANENVHSSTDYTGKVSFFRCSGAFAKMTSFITALNQAVQGKTLTQLRGGAAAAQAQSHMPKVQLFAADAKATGEEESKQQEASGAASAVEDATPASIFALQALLREVEELIAVCPPSDRQAADGAASAPTPAVSAAPASASSVTLGLPPSIPARAAPAPPPSSRFGSPAFRTFLTLLQERAPAMVERVLASVPEDELRPRVDIDAPQSAQSAQWEKEGHETLAGFKRSHARDAHSHHQVHKLPPGVVISHGPTGVGNGPSVAKPAEEGKQEGDHSHAGCGHDHGDASAADAASSTAAAPLDTSPAAKRSRLVGHLCRYLVSCWGDIRRLDYGTGHELNFVCFLAALGETGLYDAESNPMHAQRLVGCVFAQYMRLMRRLQTEYWLEPAGSRGVWGLDDFSFLPFLFGSSQLMGHRNIRPKSVRYPEILDGFSHEYMYLDCIQFILSVKTCSFAEHSPMLNDITVIKTWDQVNAGLWRMYQAEVLGKFAVVQHFIYTPLLPRWPVQPLQVQEVKEEAPCCGDAIHFPSAIAAKQTRIEPPRL